MVRANIEVGLILLCFTLHILDLDSTAGILSLPSLDPKHNLHACVYVHHYERYIRLFQN